MGGPYVDAKHWTKPRRHVNIVTYLQPGELI